MKGEMNGRCFRFFVFCFLCSRGALEAVLLSQRPSMEAVLLGPPRGSIDGSRSSGDDDASMVKFDRRSNSIPTDFSRFVCVLCCVWARVREEALAHPSFPSSFF